ncbi:MAG: dockerin type I domain-containing protein [Sedimentisphaerales bacterium]|jgi:hypothetical protein
MAQKIHDFFLSPKNKLTVKQLFLVFTVILYAISTSAGTISTTVLLSDSNIPLLLVDPNAPHVYRDVMVGTKLKIIVSSDTNKYWGDGDGNDGGSLAIEEAYQPYGVLSARGPLIEGDDWSGSHLPAAGNEAVVWDWEESLVDGFNLYTDSHNIEAGNWFVIDYNATGIGDCNVGFYDHRISWDEPVYYLHFFHVRTRDFNNDTIVDFRDLRVLTSHWLQTNCQAPDWCEGTDLNNDGKVNLFDLTLFCEFWLQRTR